MSGLLSTPAFFALQLTNIINRTITADGPNRARDAATHRLNQATYHLANTGSANIILKSLTAENGGLADITNIDRTSGVLM